jgi:hypothetical protein
VPPTHFQLAEKKRKRMTPFVPTTTSNVLMGCGLQTGAGERYYRSQ